MEVARTRGWSTLLDVARARRLATLLVFARLRGWSTLLEVARLRGGSTSGEMISPSGDPEDEASRREVRMDRDAIEGHRRDIAAMDGHGRDRAGRAMVRQGLAADPRLDLGTLRNLGWPHNEEECHTF